MFHEYIGYIYTMSCTLIATYHFSLTEECWAISLVIVLSVVFLSSFAIGFVITCCCCCGDDEGIICVFVHVKSCVHILFWLH